MCNQIRAELYFQCDYFLRFKHFRERISGMLYFSEDCFDGLVLSGSHIRHVFMFEMKHVKLTVGSIGLAVSSLLEIHYTRKRNSTVELFLSKQWMHFSIKQWFLLKTTMCRIRSFLVVATNFAPSENHSQLTELLVVTTFYTKQRG